MATAKKATRKVATKNPAKRKTTSKKPVSPLKIHKTRHNYKSFQMSNEAAPFLRFLITEQTIYWSILLILVMALGIWVLNIQISISNILEGV